MRTHDKSSSHTLILAYRLKECVFAGFILHSPNRHTKIPEGSSNDGSQSTSPWLLGRLCNFGRSETVQVLLQSWRKREREMCVCKEKRCMRRVAEGIILMSLPVHLSENMKPGSEYYSAVWQRKRQIGCVRKQKKILPNHSTILYDSTP